jgi:TolB-like protein
MPAGQQRPAAGISDLLVAVFPFDNLSGTPAPLGDMKQLLIESLAKKGIQTIAHDVLETCMAEHRIRHVGGIDKNIAQILKKSLGAQAVLITSLELYSDRMPPKIALTSRLVSSADVAVWWADGVGLAGDDHPGILGLSLIDDSQELLGKAVANLSASLAQNLAQANGEGRAEKKRGRFRPRFVHSDAVIAPGSGQTVAIAPFYNVSDRKHAGEIMALHFLTEMRRLEGITIVEPGLVRQALLALRVVMEDGLSLAYSDLIFKNLDADLILTGKVLAYEDYHGPTGKPRVDFSAILIERKTRKVAWTCKSHNEGDEGVYFFDVGRVNTAHAMASEMTRLAVETIGRQDEADN